jgi:L-ribulose-5-phosphate 3-epimerase
LDLSERNEASLENLLTMTKNEWTQRLAVCSWSLQPTDGQQLLEQIKTLNLERVQLALDPLRTQPERWSDFAEACARQKVQIVSGMFGTAGEDYSTLDSIRRTGGVVPDATWEENWRNIQVIADLAVRLHLRLITFLAGFLPHDHRDPAFVKLRGRIRQIAELFAAKGLDLAFETGQETAATLRAFLETLGQRNVGVNFDPANMLLYDKGDPIEALRTLAPWLKQCHIKDANKTKVPGTWGEEVVVGTGQVDWAGFFRTLQEHRFSGYLAIEREAGSQRAADIQAAREFVQSLKTKSVGK